MTGIGAGRDLCPDTAGRSVISHEYCREDDGRRAAAHCHVGCHRRTDDGMWRHAWEIWRKFELTATLVADHAAEQLRRLE